MLRARVFYHRYRKTYVLIDLENVAIPSSFANATVFVDTIKLVLRLRYGYEGEIEIRVYLAGNAGDKHASVNHLSIMLLEKAGVKIFYAGHNGENAADEIMYGDCLDLVAAIRSGLAPVNFCLLTGDWFFTTLIRYLRQLDLTTLLVHPPKTRSELLDTVPYHRLISSDFLNPDPPTPFILRETWEWTRTLILEGTSSQPPPKKNLTPPSPPSLLPPPPQDSPFPPKFPEIPEMPKTTPKTPKRTPEESQRGEALQV
ncbi:unnamed protein product [Microthlaspi erraticum]|uniref:NYN domain-containing protein n=1 Tax=Microthlaspi erraticum TaxID=1685480 RepID=A0A6D2K3A0_9BRAS|nr:unnamed protein product [Microthlaspi erraticum]